MPDELEKLKAENAELRQAVTIMYTTLGDRLRYLLGTGDKLITLAKRVMEGKPLKD
jgi:hypothetical protein